MSNANTSSGSSAAIEILTFPPEYSKFDVKRSQCPFRDLAQEKPSPVTSMNLGVPPIMSIRKPKSTLSSLNPTSSSGSHLKTVAIKSTRNTTSKSMADTQHRNSVKHKRSAFVPPCPDSIVLGAPKPFLGNCINTDNNRKLFTLTEDPRKRFCLRNPDALHFKTIPLQLEQQKIRELVKTADNLATPSCSQSTISSICEVIDVTNPLNLDFQGLDYKNTYQKDEQSCQNQIEYRKVRRFQHRRNVKAEMAMITEKELQEKRIAIPKHLVLQSPTIEQAAGLPTPGEERGYFGKLVRSEKKPEVKLKLEKEEKYRKERHKRLYLLKKDRLAKNKEAEMAIQATTAENKANSLAKKDIDDLVGLLDRTITTKRRDLRQIPKRRNFPHTIWETLKFRHHLKKSKRILRDRAKVKQSFYAEMGKPKSIAEAQLEISSDSASPSPRNDEESTNDEDDMIVGQQGSKFMLRGFHYKLDSNLRGKFHQKELPDGERKVKSCIIRAEWFETLVSKKKTAPTKASKLVPGMDLFPKPVGFKQPVTESPIKEFRRKPIGRHYDRVIRKNLRIKRPKLNKVRKFDLIGYLYGIEARKKVAQSVSSLHEDTRCRQTEEYIHNKARADMLKKRTQKHRRMHYLGIPCPKRQRDRSKSICVDSDSKVSEWIPDSPTEDGFSPGSPDIQRRDNMPAPEYRETTLCRHPRRPRNYNLLRVPSAQFDKFVQEQGIPVMEKIWDDKKVIENVGVINNTEYARRFDARHHHDHWNPTQHKTIRVRYATKVVKPKPIEAGSKEQNDNLPKTFDKSRPIRYNVDEIDFSMNRHKTNELKKEYNREVVPTVRSKSRLAKPSLDPPKIFHSMEEGTLEQFPGRDKFLSFIHEIKLDLDKRAGHTDTQLAIDETAYLGELKEDLRSIESCLSSLSSSQCTNLSNDSGSFLMAGDKKIPLDYIRKSVVPFEQVQARSRFEAVPIDAAKETLNPYRTVPFAGQQKVQLSMGAPRDSFFTFNTRLQNGLRLRLEVNAEDPRKKLIGKPGGTKANAEVATDIDELYIEDLGKRPTLKQFKWNSCRTMIKEALRKKFESMLIQGEIVRTKISDRRNEKDFQQLSQMKELFEKLFAKWEKKEYDSAMEVVNKVKPYYEATDKYRTEAQELAKRYAVLNMEIVNIEYDWMRRTILQNFHYLLADMEWRVKHDWIHRDVDGAIEGFRESILKRNTTNIRQREKDDAWAIKEYFDNVYTNNCHSIVFVFDTTKDFTNGIENLKSKTFVLLLELQNTLWILAELRQKYEEFSDWCRIELESKKNYAENKCANKYFMENRAKQLKAQVKACLGQPIDATFSDKRFSEMKGICNQVYSDMVSGSSQIVTSPMEQVAAISQVLTDILGKFEEISVDRRQKVEKKYRRLLEYRRNMSKQAVLVERRIASEMVKVRHNLEAPFQKTRRQGTLPRSELKKIVRTIPAKRVKISEKTKFFYKAFHEEGDLKGLKEARESLDVMDDIQESIVPFYFDHFLRINGYQPNYNFKTDVELRDGPEIDRFQVKHLLPEVLEKFEKWQAMKKRIMEENINKNPEMYQNVQI